MILKQARRIATHAPHPQYLGDTYVNANLHTDACMPYTTAYFTSAAATQACSDSADCVRGPGTGVPAARVFSRVAIQDSEVGFIDLLRIIYFQAQIADILSSAQAQLRAWGGLLKRYDVSGARPCDQGQPRAWVIDCAC